MDAAKRHHQARGHREQLARLDTVCAAVTHCQRELTALARPGTGAKLVLEFDLLDGFVGTVRAHETRIHKIPRRAAA